MNINGVGQELSLLGEGLQVSKDVVYWLDINSHKVFQFDSTFSAIEGVIAYPSLMFLLENQPHCLNKEGVWELDFSNTKALKKKSIVIDEAYRTNDGVLVDSRYLLFGTMLFKPAKKQGDIYIYDFFDGSLKKLLSGIAIPNSFVILPTKEVLISDSFEKKIYKFNIDYVNQTMINVDLWADFSSESMTPDGACISSQNLVYVAMWGGACINVFDLDANLVNKIEVPMLNPTNCKLSLDEEFLYVTSASEDMSGTELANYPMSGRTIKVALK